MCSEIILSHRLFFLVTLSCTAKQAKVSRPPSLPHRFEGIRLLQYQTFGLFVMFCQAVFILFVIYFTGREALLMYRQRCKYFQNYWSYAEMGILVACYLGIVIYVLRLVPCALLSSLWTCKHTSGV